MHKYLDLYAYVCHNWGREAREHGIGNFTCARGSGEASGECPFSRVALTRRLSQSLYIYPRRVCIRSVYKQCVYEVCVEGVFRRCIYEVYIYMRCVYMRVHFLR